MPRHREPRDAGGVTGLSELTSFDIASHKLTVLIPVGSCEQHGPHLPLDTDTRIASAVCYAVAARSQSCVVAPAMPFSASDEHAGFVGLLSLGTETTTAVLVALARSAARWARHVVFVNGHGGNHDALARFAGGGGVGGAVGGDASGRVHVWSPRVDGDAHAGHVETSLMLAIAPREVRTERLAAGALEPLAALLPAMRSGGVRAVTANGVLGDPTSASAAVGHCLLAGFIDDLSAVVDALPA